MSLTLDTYRALPRERALAMVRRAFAAGRTGDGLAGLAVHFDAALLAEVLAQDTHVPAEALGELGAPAVALIAASARRVPAEHRESRYEGLLRAMAAAVAAGLTPPPAWDADLAWQSFAGTRLRGWSHSASVRDAMTVILAAMPAVRRHAVLLRGLAECPERAIQQLPLAEDPAVIDEGIRLLVRAHARATDLRVPLAALGARAIAPLARHLALAGGDAQFLERLEDALPAAAFAEVMAASATPRESKLEALARLVAEARKARPRAKRLRVYLLEPASDELLARAGSRSCVGGPPVGLADEDIPRDRFGDPYTHLLTIDLDDAPELRQRYPEAGAIAVLCPEATDAWMYLERSVVVAVPAARAATAAPGAPGRPLAVIGLEVPAVTFTAPGKDPSGALDRLRRAIFSAGGHLLGHPLWIQDGDADDELLLQINDGLVPGLNLGDVGSLYFLDGGEVAFQCH